MKAGLRYGTTFQVIPEKLDLIRHEVRRKLDHYEMTIPPLCTIEPLVGKVGKENEPTLLYFHLYVMYEAYAASRR